MYPKMFDNLKPSPLYQKNQLSYETMNEIYKRSTTIPNFAKNAMLHLFDMSELLRCKRVMHVDRTEGTIFGLDEARFEAIRQMVEENAGTISQQLTLELLPQRHELLNKHPESARVNVADDSHEWTDAERPMM